MFHGEAKKISGAVLFTSERKEMLQVSEEMYPRKCRVGYCIQGSEFSSSHRASQSAQQTCCARFRVYLIRACIICKIVDWWSLQVDVLVDEQIGLSITWRFRPEFVLEGYAHSQDVEHELRT